MGDNAFPTVRANGAFLQGFMKEKGMISERVTGQPPRALSYESEQVLGGPEIVQVQSTDMPAMGPEIPQGMVGPATESMFPGYLQRRDELLRRLGRLKKV